MELRNVNDTQSWANYQYNRLRRSKRDVSLRLHLMAGVGLLRSSISRSLQACAIAALMAYCSSQVWGQSEIRLRDICRLKGQETNTLHGLGYVVGLKGSGDTNLKPMSRSLAQIVRSLGGPVASDLQGQLVDKELEATKNVAMVYVQATIPPAGVQAGDTLACTVNAIYNAKSLDGGVLIQTALVGPRADQPVVYALAQGPLVIEDLRNPNSAKIVNGCKMEANVVNEYVVDNTFTLVLEPSHSSFGMAQQVETAVNQSIRDFLLKPSGGGYSPGVSANQMSSPLNYDEMDAAKALDQTHIRVRIPAIYQDSPVQIISEVLNLPLVLGKNNRRVVINEREGVLVIGEDVEIAPVAISHKNVTISTRSSSGSVERFVGFGYEQQTAANDRTTLKELVKALNTLAVPTDDLIAIIKAIEKQGNLFGELVVE